LFNINVLKSVSMNWTCVSETLKALGVMMYFKLGVMRA